MPKKTKQAQYDAFTRRTWKTRPRNAGPLIARNLIVRALRGAGLSHILRGHMSVVGVLYPPSLPVEWLVQAGNALLREGTSKLGACIQFSARTGRRSKHGRHADLA